MRRQRSSNYELSKSIQIVRVMGAPFVAVTESEAARMIVEGALAKRGHWAITANLDHLRRYMREPLARKLINEASLVVADGTPLIWASRLAGTPLPERVAGSNMIWTVCDTIRRSHGSVFLLGGNPGVAKRAAEVLERRYIGLDVAGTFCPAPGFEHNEDELKLIEERVCAASPDVVLVALGFPKQDILIARLRCLLPTASFMGVGISLSFVAGEIPRAPDWTHMIGLEWVHRLIREPKRLARRYLIQGVPFALLLLRWAAKHRMRSILQVEDDVTFRGSDISNG
jgi:N-acetylglucosaminyldiphosphoundecaprenol N-acetyl-beta-D-mannosaminyltransferase